jgi:hypothetical protein
MSAEVDCPLCGASYIQDSPWKKICLKCYLKQKKKDGTYKEREYTPPARPTYTPAPVIEPMMLKRLIQLCHPDKHSGSEGANIATRFLLELKARM